jgi:hypothetical protein
MAGNDARCEGHGASAVEDDEHEPEEDDAAWPRVSGAANEFDHRLREFRPFVPLREMASTTDGCMRLALSARHHLLKELGNRQASRVRPDAAAPPKAGSRSMNADRSAAFPWNPAP